MNNNNCDIIDIGRWLLDIISNIMECNCRDKRK
jgi:hypothetical protein